MVSDTNKNEEKSSKYNEICLKIYNLNGTYLFVGR